MFLNPIFILFIFFLLVFLSHLLFIEIFKLNKKQWLVMEYGIIIGSAFSIIFLITDARALIMSNLYTLEKSRTETAYILLLEGIGKSSACIKFAKTEFSLPNFEEIQKEYDKVCAWKEELSNKLPTHPLTEYPQLNYKDYKPNFEVTNKALIDTLGIIERTFGYYNESRNKMLHYGAQVSKNDIETIIFFINPYLLVTALALQLTKVTADIRRIKKS